MTSVSKNVYIEKFDDIINIYDDSYQSTIKMKPVVVKSNIYIDSREEINDKNPKFKIGDIVRILKYKNIFAKCYTLNLSEEVFMIKKVKNTAPWTHAINDLNGEEIVGTFYGIELQKNKRKSLQN